MDGRKSTAKEYALLVLGSVIMSYGIKNIYGPVNLVSGGLSGVAIILQGLFGIPLWVSNTVLNIPLFLIGFRVRGWTFIKRTLVATVVMSLALMVMPEVYLIPNGDILLSAVFGGIVCGIGAGLVFVCRATTGGTDLLAAIIQTRLRHVTVPQILQVLDWLIVLIGASVFGVSTALYAVIAIYALTKVSDGIIDGMHFAKAAYIISEESGEIAGRIMQRLERGVTGIPARGLYSGRDTQMLYCVISNREVAVLKDLVHEVDPNAFVIVSDVREVLGEGFRQREM